MNPGGVHPELLEQVIHQKLHEEEIIEAGHPFLAGGGRVAPLAAVVALVLAPRLPATCHVTSRDTCLVMVSTCLCHTRLRTRPCHR